MQFTINLQAGRLHRQETQGRYFALIDTGAASSIAATFRRGHEVLEQVRTAVRGMTARTDQGFTAIELQSAVDCVCELVISDGQVSFDAVNGATVKVTADTPLPVSNDRGSPGNLLHVAGVSLADAPAVSLGVAGPVAAGPVAALVAASSLSRRALRLLNLGPSAVALGPAALTWAQRSVVLEPGEMWLEDRAANLDWYAITSAGGAASVNVQEVNA